MKKLNSFLSLESKKFRIVTKADEETPGTSDQAEKPADQDNNLKALRSLLNSIHIDPFGNLYYVWIITVSVAYIYNLVFIIARTSFWLLQEFKIVWILFDFMSDLIYFIDILFTLVTGYMENGELCIERTKIARRYLKTVHFKIDILSVLPLDLVVKLFLASTSSKLFLVPALRLNKLLKSYRLSEFRTITETKTKFPTIFRMANLLLNILLAMHWNACMYFIISRVVGFGSDSWVFPKMTSPSLLANLTVNELDNILHTHKLDVQYIFCFWWSVLTLTTIGEVPQPTIYYQEMYMAVLLMIGVIILAITIGSAAGMVQNANSRSLELQMKSDYAKTFLKQNKISGELETRIHSYLDYLWIAPDLNQGDVLDCLPDNLRKEIAMNVHMETLKRVHVFQDCEPGLLEELVTKLKLQVYSPGDYVCRKGDVGHEVTLI